MVTWDLEALYKQEDKDIIKKEILTLTEELMSSEEKLSSDMSPEQFIELVKKKELLSEKISILVIKNNLALSIDTNNSQYRKLDKEFSTFTSEIQNKLLFFNHFIKDLSAESAQKFIDNSGKYKFALESIRRGKPYTKSPLEEKILNIKSTTSSDALTELHEILRSSFRFEYEGEKKTFEELAPLRQSKDPTLRKKVYASFLKTWREQESLMGEIYIYRALDWYNSAVKIRGYKSPISARNFSNDIGDSTVDLVLDVIRKKQTLFHEYFAFKAELLGYENERSQVLAPYPYDDEKEYDYQTSKNIVLNIMKDFSPVFEEKTRLVFDENRVHSEIQEGKRGGAFCYQILKSTIPYVMVNHNNKFNDLSTLAHEMGHAVHGQLATDKTAFTWHSSIPLAEVASTFTEELLAKKMFKESTSDEEKKYFLCNALDGYFSTIIRQAYYCLFEIEAHDKIKDGASVDDLHEIHYKLQKERFGDMKLGEEWKREWLCMPHIHNSPFYVYSYAFAQLTTLALYDQYDNLGQEFVPKYTAILSAGGDDTVENIMLTAGFDITKREFWDGAFNQIEKKFDLLKELCAKDNP